MITQIPSEIETDARKYLTLIYGEAGTGKTTMASQIDGHYFAICEAGTKGVSVYGHTVTTWEEFISLLLELIQQQRDNWEDVREVQTLVIDTIDKLYQYCGDYICRTTTFLEKGVPASFDRIEDVVWGKGYKRTNALLVETINKMMLLGFGVVLIGHTADKILKWKGQDVTLLNPNLPPKGADALVDACDAVGYCMIEEEVTKGDDLQVTSIETGRWCYWQPAFLRRTKHRLAGFPVRLLLRKDTMWKDYLTAFNQTTIQNQNQNQA